VLHAALRPLADPVLNLRSQRSLEANFKTHRTVSPSVNECFHGFGCAIRTSVLHLAPV